MSLRRATIRREQKQREKIMKSHSPDGELARAREQGKIDGRVLSVLIASIYLHSEFGWGANRIIELIEQGNREACRYDNAGVQFALEFYAKRIAERMNQKDGKARKVFTTYDKIYTDNRSDYFLTGLSVICSCLVNYGYASKENGTGRADRLIDRCLDEFIHVLDGDMDVEKYICKVREEVGINFK